MGSFWYGVYLKVYQSSAVYGLTDKMLSTLYLYKKDWIKKIGYKDDFSLNVLWPFQIEGSLIVIYTFVIN